VGYLYDRRTAKDVSIDFGLIESLRKDFLTLMKNIPRVNDYATAHRLNDAFKVYRKNFDDLFFERFLNRDFKYDTDVSEGDRTWFDRELRKSGWDFSIELRVPIGYADTYWSEESRYESFVKERTKWANRVKDKARVFWSDIRKFLEWYARNTHKEQYSVKVPDTDQVELEGFKVIVEGYDETDEYSRDYMERFKEGLKVFRQRAAQVLPIMLQHMLPIKLIAWVRALDEGGRYLGPSKPIEFTLRAFSEDKNPQRVAQVLAHEMGHHLYGSYLSGGDKKFWDDAVRGDYQPIDLQKLLDVWPPSMQYAEDFVAHMKDKDPNLALAVDVASYGKKFGHQGFGTRDEAVARLAQGEEVYAPKNPITGYATKNAEEAFCEAVGMLVGFGPSAVHEIVKHWLSVILPNVKISRSLVRASLTRSRVNPNHFIPPVYK